MKRRTLADLDRGKVLAGLQAGRDAALRIAGTCGPHSAAGATAAMLARECAWLAYLVTGKREPFGETGDG